MLPSCVVERLTRSIKTQEGLIQPSSLLAWVGPDLPGDSVRKIQMSAIAELKGELWNIELGMVPIAGHEGPRASAFHAATLRRAVRDTGADKIASTPLGELHARFAGAPAPVFLEFLAGVEAEHWRLSSESEDADREAESLEARSDAALLSAILATPKRRPRAKRAKRSSRFRDGMISLKAGASVLGGRAQEILVLDASGVPLFTAQYLGRHSKLLDLRPHLCSDWNAGNTISWELDDEGLRLLSSVVLRDGRVVSGDAAVVPLSFDWLSGAPSELLKLELATIPLLPFIVEELSQHGLRTARDLVGVGADHQLSGLVRRALNATLKCLANALNLRDELPRRRELLVQQQQKTAQLLTRIAEIEVQKRLAAQFREEVQRRRKVSEQLEAGTRRVLEARSRHVLDVPKEVTSPREVPKEVTFRTRVIDGAWFQVTEAAALVYSSSPRGIQVLDVDGATLGTADYDGSRGIVRLRSYLEVGSKRVLVKATAGALKFLDAVPLPVALPPPAPPTENLATLNWLAQADKQLLLTKVADLTLSVFTAQSLKRLGVRTVGDLTTTRLPQQLRRELNAALTPLAERLACEAARAGIEPSDPALVPAQFEQLVAQGSAANAASLSTKPYPNEWIAPELRCLFSPDPADWPPQCGPDEPLDSLLLPVAVLSRLSRSGFATVRSLMGPQGLESMLKMPYVGRRFVAQVAEAIASGVRMKPEEREREMQLILAFDEAVRKARGVRRRARLEAGRVGANRPPGE